MPAEILSGTELAKYVKYFEIYIIIPNAFIIITFLIK